ncbi:GMC family oxidoreductase [Actinocrispum sp. NPDC049592]|uniref:GMC family oxidoreductase n=1 Tax=Actinocrispum sp. NPDC049592 TaxID=3154835 RepID=UPI003417FEC7
MSVEHVEVVVIGSGFGGSVTAYRAAQAGRSVVLLERGRAYPPGGFARTPAELRRNFWDPAAERFGLFDMWSFPGFDSVVSSGLGGGSLIYANVLLRKDERWFVKDEHETWPITRADLEPHYDAVQRMLQPTPYPLEHDEFSDCPKTHAMKETAAGLGLEWSLPPLAVRFSRRPGGRPAIGLPIAEPYYGNLHGKPRRTCRLCGECDIGCNEGAKNSLDHTYLSAAKYHGADIRTLCEAQVIRPRDEGGYEVGYVVHDGMAVAKTITCDRLVLAAGSFGTTQLLLRNRKHLGGLSPALGTRFSGNGDLIAFLLRAQHGDKVLEGSRGPVITSTIRVPDTVDGGDGRGYYVQDAGHPAFVDWIVENATLPERLVRLAGFVARRMVTGNRSGEVSHQVAELLSDGTLSASSLPLLGMGRDIPDGVMRLRDGKLDVAWTTRTSRAYFDRVRATMKRISESLGGDYVDSPTWWHKRIIVAHPLGGAPIGSHPGEGVCDPFGEVFEYPGLYVADGAAMPGPVGANPAFTIAAMADRLSDRLADAAVPHRVGGAVRAAPAVPAGIGGSAGTASLTFTERMTGPFVVSQGESASTMTLELTVTIDDLDKFLADPAHPARAEGSVECAGLNGWLPVRDGVINLMIPGPGQGHRQMLYRLHLEDGAGNHLTLSGHKDLHDDPGMDMWPDTSTLTVRLQNGRSPDEHAPVLGAGVLRIRKRDFLRQLGTIKADPETARRFGTFFVGELWDQYSKANGRR